MKLLYLISFAIIMNACGSKDDDDVVTPKGPELVIGGVGEKSSSDLRLEDAVLAGSPTMMKIKFYASWVSENKDCSDPILVQDFEDDPQTVDMFDGPEIFKGEIPEGEYPCVILKMADVFSFKVDKEAVDTHSACTSTSKIFKHDIYREDNTSEGQYWLDLNGKKKAPTGTSEKEGEDTVYLFASTAVKNYDEDSTSPLKANGKTIDIYQSVILADPLVSPGTSSFYFDMSNAIANSEDEGVFYCRLEGDDDNGFGFE